MLVENCNFSTQNSTTHRFQTRLTPLCSGVHPPKSMMHIAHSLYFRKMYKLPPYFC